MKRGRSGRQGPPTWLWVAPLVLAAHALLFWAAAGKNFLPIPRGGRAGQPTGAHAPTAIFSVREVTVNHPQTGEPTTHQEFTVSTRLASPAPSVVLETP